MLAPKLQRFTDPDLLFSCPLCQQKLRLVERSLKCPQGHSYDLAKFGYVNLAPQAKASHDFDKSSFEQRRLILENGFYQHILEKLLEILADRPDLANILDVGCGEGYYARQIEEKTGKNIYAFDLSKDSIQLAAREDKAQAVKWFVADLAHLPIESQSIDCLLDIFSPANYQEFERLLSAKGLLIKVIPNADHLQEIRQLAQDQLQQKEYSNHEVLQHFKEHFELAKLHHVHQTFDLNKDERDALLAMTPLLFHVQKDKIDWSQLRKITISATVLVGKKKTV